VNGVLETGSPPLQRLPLALELLQSLPFRPKFRVRALAPLLGGERSESEEEAEKRKEETGNREQETGAALDAAIPAQAGIQVRFG
jgi:hypothetical protein